MTPRALLRALATAALALSVAAPAAARGQRHAPAGSGSQPAAAVPRSSPSPSPSPSPAPAPAPRSSAGGDSGSDRGGQATSRSGGSDNSQSDNDRQTSSSTGSPGRHRGNLPATGEAVARTRPPHGGGGHGGVIVGYPWWYGGAYYGYYAYDPWFGWYPSYDPGPAAAATSDDGALKIKVKPTDATVYVDGYYVGVVDEFDGVFQELKLVSGPHHIEILAPEFETLAFDVLIQPDHTMTYRGEMVRNR